MLTTEYRLTTEEIRDLKRRVEDHNPQLCYAILFVVFRNLNYFPDLKEIPISVIDHIKEQLQLPNSKFIAAKSTLSRNRQRIYNHFDITPWNYKRKTTSGKLINPGLDFAINTALQASKTHNYPADIINVVIQEMRSERYELPTFKQLDRLVRHARTEINQAIFKMIYSRLCPEKIVVVDKLLVTVPDYQRTEYNQLKNLPKNPTITNFRDLLKHYDWLISFGEIDTVLEGISSIKLRQFAQQARSLDASDLKDFKDAKQCALILCLIQQAQVEAKDALITTFNKTIVRMHKRGKDKLKALKESYQERTQELLIVFSSVLTDFIEDDVSLELAQKVSGKLHDAGGAPMLHLDCEQALALNSDNHLPLLRDYYKNNRATLLRLLKTIDIKSSTQEDGLVSAMDYVIDHNHVRSEYLPNDVSLDFTTDQWRKLIVNKDTGEDQISRHNLELCILSHVANDLRSGDMFVDGADFYADYREGLLPWDVCEKMVNDYCQKINIAVGGAACVKQLKEKLENKARLVDNLYPDLSEFVIDKNGRPILKKRGPTRRPSSAVWLHDTIKSRMPERNLIDVLCSSHFYCGWAHELGPVSGDEPKINDAINRYILTTFAYATGLGPTQTAQHVRNSVSAHMLSWANKRHVTPDMLDRSRKHLINLIKQFKLTKCWGEGKSVACDGTLEELREQNIVAEFHMRYKKKGGIAYHHVADNYVLLFSTFMPCGVWEAVEIIEGLLKNDSDIQPDIIHGDTQSQSTIVFAMAYLLGFKLMPRIRNWKDVKMFRPNKGSSYQNIDTLFSESIKWDLIEKHWQDMMQVVLSIYKGKISSSVLLKKLGNYSRKNRLYQAFQELGRVIRTLFLLEYISDVELRETIDAETNKVESYNGLSDWCTFGSDVLVASNDAIEMEKAVKYTGLLTNSVMLQNISDMTRIIAQLIDEGHRVTKDDMSYLSPYLTAHLKRFGDIVMDLDNIPKSVEGSRKLVIW